MIQILQTVVMGIIPFLFVLGLVVTIHELGHFLAAKWCGVAIDRFAINFGRPLLAWKDRGRHDRILLPLLPHDVRRCGQVQRPSGIGPNLRHSGAPAGFDRPGSRCPGIARPIATTFALLPFLLPLLQYN